MGEGPKKVLKGKYEVNIQKSNGDLFSLMKFVGDLDKKGKGSRHKGILVSKLDKEKDQFLQNGTLVFVGYVQINSFEENEDNNDGKFALKKNVESEIPLTALLGKTFKESNDNPEHGGNYSDFKIICDDGKERKLFNVHRVIISAGSPVFNAMLTNNCKESIDKSATISDISIDTMEKLLHFMYTDNVEMDNADTDLLLAANKYQIGKLKAICESHLINGLTESNAFHLGVVSDLHGSELFKNEVAKFIAKNWLKSKKNIDFDTMKKSPELMSRIMTYYN